MPMRKAGEEVVLAFLYLGSTPGNRRDGNWIFTHLTFREFHGTKAILPSSARTLSGIIAPASAPIFPEHQVSA